MHIVSSSIPFAPIRWWAAVVGAESLVIDTKEHFQKMSYRNRYNISGANNPIQLSVPLVNGRDQRVPMADVRIHNEDNWQLQHWRTLASVYKRSPYWEFYEPTLEPLFTTRFTHLIEFNATAFQWVQKQLKVNISISEADLYVAQYPDTYKDLRHLKPAREKKQNEIFPRYYQLFEERIGFHPNLSILDLLCSEGPATKAWLTDNKQNLL